MATATQYDIFGNARAVDPTGRRHTTGEYTERCNLCCIPFENEVLPPVGHFFYLGFHICERCKMAFDEAEEDKRNGKRIVRWKDVEFFLAGQEAARRGGTVAIAIDGTISGFLGKSKQVRHWIGQGVRHLPYRKLEGDHLVEQLFDLSVDVGLLNDGMYGVYSYRYDNMIAEMYDNIAYNRLVNYEEGD